MHALKRELKLNNAETAQMRGNAGFKRWAYNFGLNTIQASWDLEVIKAGDSKRIDAIKKVFTHVIVQETGNAWMKKYPSTIYQSASIALKDAFARWRKGLTSFPKKKTKKKGDSLTVYKTSGIYPTVGLKISTFQGRWLIVSRLQR